MQKLPQKLSRQTLFSIISGLIGGVIFSVTAYTGNGGLLTVFLPVLPLALPGLAFGAKYTGYAAIAACAIVAAVIDGGSMLVFAALTALPVVYLLRKLLLWRGEDGARQWHPVLPILAELAVISAAVFMMIAIAETYSEPGELKTIISKELASNLKADNFDTDPQIAHFVKLLIDDWSFLIFAFASWLWVTMIYAFTVLANILLAQNNLALRTKINLLPNGLPVWLLALVVISGGLAFFGKGNDRYVGEAVFLMLLLPYFLAGIATIHLVSLQWKLRKFWLTVCYIALVLYPVLSVVAIAIGLYKQLQELKSHASPVK